MLICVNLVYADYVFANTLIGVKFPELERQVGNYMTNYPVGDFLIKIKNAALARRKNVTVPYSKIIYSVSEVLKKEMYLSEVKKEDGCVSVKVAFVKKESVLVELKLVSKPGKRVYANCDELREHKGLSFFMLSTPGGIMTSKDAVKKNIGGEVIAEIH